VGDVNWHPLGAPGGDGNGASDDFTPPFPSWTSGHATMGSAVFKSLELFFGTNSFSVAAANNGVNPGDGEYTLSSAEFAANGIAGMTRDFNTFIQSGLLADLNIGTEDSPEGENSMSRVYLGVHWIFDQRDGSQLGRSIADYVFAHNFQFVAPAENIPEPAAIILTPLACCPMALAIRRRRR
jgi:hypothetical protein